MTDLRGETREKRSAMGVLDVILLAVAVLGLATVWAVQLAVVPRFVAMFADFGSDVALPALTQLVTGPVVASVASLVGLGAAGAGVALRRARQRSVGMVALVAAALVAWLTVPLMLFALYQPILTLSGAIQP